MKPDFQQLMNNATRLTHSGDLQAATAAIQAALGLARTPAEAAAETSTASPVSADTAIDVEAREVAPDQKAAEGVRTHEVRSGPQTQFVAGRFSSGSAARDYKLFVPAGVTAPAPLIVMLHGCTQTPDDFAAGTAMNEVAQVHGCYVLYPAQSQQANPQRCWNWFKHTHQQRGRGEPALLAGMTRQVMAQHAIDADRVFVAGLSAGGAMAAILGDTYADLYAAVGVHSGLAAGAASDLPSALAAMNGGGSHTAARAGQLPTIVFHGDADSTVHPRNGDAVTAASSGGAGAPEIEKHLAPGGRRSTRTVHRDPQGTVLAEYWVVHGAPHAWAGGSAKGSYTDARGPNASAEMLRFFLEHPRPSAR